MDFFHLRSVPGYRWPPLPDSIFSQVWNAYLELDCSQWLNRVELEQRQLQQVRTLLSHCMSKVPYYRRVLPAAGIVPSAIRTMDDFRRIPLLPQRVYQAQVSTGIASALPPGTVGTRTMQSSGSSGAPTDVHLTNWTDLWWHAFYLRDLEWCNIDPTGTLAAIRVTRKTGEELQLKMAGVTQPSWSPALDPLIQMGMIHAMDITQDPRLQLQWLRRVAPDYLLSYPAGLEVLARLVRREGPIPSLRAIQSISDSLTTETQKMIEEAFGVPVKNTYSCTEVGYLASPCPEGHGLHVHGENVLLEVLDSESRPCKPGETGQVYITHLHNMRGPFVRYALGDEATVGPEQCPCGRGLPLLTKVHGKSSPMFSLPQGGQKHSVLAVVQLRLVGGHWQLQLVQKALDHAVVRVAVDPSWTDHHADEMKRVVQEFFESPIRVDVEIHDHLALPQSGKFQSMINLVV